VLTTAFSGGSAKAAAVSYDDLSIEARPTIQLRSVPIAEPVAGCESRQAARRQRESACGDCRLMPSDRVVGITPRETT
jgi:hypothetical protein